MMILFWILTVLSVFSALSAFTAGIIYMGRKDANSGGFLLVVAPRFMMAVAFALPAIALALL